MKSNPVNIFAKWHTKNGQLPHVLTLLKEVALKSRQEPGNLFYTVHQNNAEANILLLFEGYANEDALAAHRSAEYFQELVIGKIVPLLESREIALATRLDI